MEEKFALCRDLHQQFLKNTEYSKGKRGLSSTEDFWTPVNWEEMGIPDYPKVIKQRMDLSTIEVGT